MTTDNQLSELKHFTHNEENIAGRKEGNLGAYAIKRVAAGAHLPTPWLFSLRNAQTIEPTTALTAVSFPSASTRYSFSHLSGAGRAVWANSGEDSAQ